MKKLLRVIGWGIGCLFLLLLLGVGFVVTTADISASAGCTLPSGRSVNPTSHTWRGVDLAQKPNNIVEINTAGYSIVVTPKQLIVDGRTFAEIDDKVKSVDIDITNREIAFRADGDPVGSLVR